MTDKTMKCNIISGCERNDCVDRCMYPSPPTDKTNASQGDAPPLPAAELYDGKTWFYSGDQMRAYAESVAAPLRAENEALRQRIAELERIAGQQWLDAVRENQEQFDRAEAAERDLLALRQFFDLNPSSLGAKLQAAERELADAEVIIAMRERELAALKRPVEDAEIGGTCNVCGGGVRYGERHYQCGRAVIGIETELAEARAQLAEARKDETDAQRYRWWRAFWMTEEPSPEAFISAATEDEVDAAVDAEIAKGKP